VAGSSFCPSTESPSQRLLSGSRSASHLGLEGDALPLAVVPPVRAAGGGRDRLSDWSSKLSEFGCSRNCGTCSRGAQQQQPLLLLRLFVVPLGCRSNAGLLDLLLRRGFEIL
jgi:hypothetical protein